MKIIIPKRSVSVTVKKSKEETAQLPKQCIRQVTLTRLRARCCGSPRSGQAIVERQQDVRQRSLRSLLHQKGHENPHSLRGYKHKHTLI
jgi:hypothetical protein